MLLREQGNNALRTLPLAHRTCQVTAATTVYNRHYHYDTGGVYRPYTHCRETAAIVSH